MKQNAKGRGANLKVLHLFPRFNRGGAERVIGELASGMQNFHIQGLVACSGGEWTDHLDELGIHWLRLSFLYPSSSINIVRGFFALRSVVARNDVDLIHSHHRFCSLVGRAVALASRIPFMCTVHDLASGNRLITSWAAGDTITVFSQAVESHLIDSFNIKKEYIRRIPIGIRPPAVLSSGQVLEMKSGLGYAPEVPLIGFIGRLVHEKAPDLFLRAVPEVLNRFPNARFCVVGDGVMKNDLSLLVDALGVREFVTFLGGRDDVSSLISCFDFVVIPSRREGFGLVALESLAQGKPVIASRVGGLPELVQDGQNGLLVPPGQPSAIAEAMINLLDNPEQVKKMGYLAREMIQGQFSMDAMMQGMDAMYSALLQRYVC